MRKSFYIFIFVLPLLLSSCSVSFNEFTRYTKDEDDYTYIEGNGYYKPNSYTLDYQEIIQDWPYNNKEKQIAIPSTGEQNLLVIPVDFNNKPCSALKFGCDVIRTQISNAFFGTDNKNTYQSVASYYNSSSFGKLHLHGKVADWYTSPYEIEQIRNNRDLVDEIVKNAINDYKSKNKDINKFDTNKDGYIDGVAIIYAHEYENKNSSFWAYESSLSLMNANVEDPQPRSYLWASYEYMNANSEMDKVDAHTYIHEAGHLFGLSDYYSRDDSQTFRPLGGMDMMDYNLGDNNVFSKMLLKWTRPYVVTGSSEITINASYINGECILVPAGEWNGSAMDEYLLIELYSPHGLNKIDSKLKYNDGVDEFSLMSKAGIKMYHVDARVAYYMTFNSSPFIGYLGDEGLEEKLELYDKAGQRYYRKIDHSNTLIESRNGIPLIEVIDRHGQDYLKVGNLYNNDSLLVKGDRLIAFNFNNGNELEYEVLIKEVKSNKATIQFIKKSNNSI
ncbi:MAG: hypothetical protein J1F32_05390 [Erysipelotrichales bacterium]|nr:hypothetical protein [Erysipelotrichales bacterium]